MEISSAYIPQDIFAPERAGNGSSPRVLIAPQRYIQGDGVLDGIGRYLSLLNAKRVAVLISERGRQHEGIRLFDSLRAADMEPLVRIFNGECSIEEIEVHARELADPAVDCVLAVGGGKCADTGKAVAFRLGTPVAIVPTLASNDAPCSALSVLYSPEGVTIGAEFYPQNPALVVVDTGIVAAAPERYLVAGVGDGMATWYEARVCLLNDAAVTTVGARPTLASFAIGEACAKTIFDEGSAAAAAVAASAVNEALEKVVEANTLLSGLGFESGGLATAHGVAQSYTGIPSVHANYLHGEMVAMGTLTQLAMESRTDEAVRVAEFFASVGLPVHLGQMSLNTSDTSALNTIVEGALAFPFIENMPLAVDAEAVRSAILNAHDLGLSAAAKVGDAAYRRLHRD
jgi:glycerol dehydrogenase